MKKIKVNWEFIWISVIYFVVVIFIMFIPIKCEWYSDDILFCNTLFGILIQNTSLYQFFDSIVITVAFIFILYSMIYLIYAKIRKLKVFNVIYIIIIAIVVLILIPVIF